VKVRRQHFESRQSPDTKACCTMSAASWISYLVSNCMSARLTCRPNCRLQQRYSCCNLGDESGLSGHLSNPKHRKTSTHSDTGIRQSVYSWVKRNTKRYTATRSEGKTAATVDRSTQTGAAMTTQTTLLTDAAIGAGVVYNMCKHASTLSATGSCCRGNLLSVLDKHNLGFSQN